MTKICSDNLRGFAQYFTLIFKNSFHGNWHIPVPVFACFIHALLNKEESKCTWNLSNSSYSSWHFFLSLELLKEKSSVLFMFQCSQMCFNLHKITWRLRICSTLCSCHWIHSWSKLAKQLSNIDYKAFYKF